MSLKNTKMDRMSPRTAEQAGLMLSVESQPDGKRHRKLVQMRPPVLVEIAKHCKEQRRQLIEFFSRNYKDFDDAKASLSPPDVTVDIPYPFCGTVIPKRFALRGKKSNEKFHYMGREIFSQLVDKFDKMKDDARFGNLWVYGLMGYGKSHLLATLTCFLTAQGYQVIYLPDARVCHKDPVDYFPQSMLLTWADFPEKVEEIRYLNNVKACITGGIIVSEEVPAEYVDHRFFDEKEGRGYCLCGAVREAVTNHLGELGTILLSTDDSFKAMNQAISNSSVARYFLEHVILRSIALNRLACLNIPPAIPQLFFKGFPSYNTDLTNALYVSNSYNFSGINAVFLRTDPENNTAELIPIQITIQKAHAYNRSSEEQFFRNWSSWRTCLFGYSVSSTFLWITADGTHGTTYRKSYATCGHPDKVLWPDYNSVCIPLREVN
ncbi:hypothetical protein AJ79_03205 [Helicocarpus griseus UAMH5409]|uniref:Uncharacterized protein n=1 Tax=Helicocarpus griseus UAMH5409 TaxID=1447875 RepID=A0A2B7XYY1_9EURO|nr:hypothetical protein AJ79_03205 [Helicocarpus griseus UAMH5409]